MARPRRRHIPASGKRDARSRSHSGRRRRLNLFGDICGPPRKWARSAGAGKARAYGPFVRQWWRPPVVWPQMADNVDGQPETKVPLLGRPVLANCFWRPSRLGLHEAATDICAPNEQTDPPEQNYSMKASISNQNHKPFGARSLSLSLNSFNIHEMRLKWAQKRHDDERVLVAAGRHWLWQWRSPATEKTRKLEASRAPVQMRVPVRIRPM